MSQLATRFGRIDWCFTLVIVLLTLCALGGGASRDDVLSLLYLRPIAVVFATIFLLSPSRVDWPVIRAPLIMLAALALLGVIQLVPLPPDWWLALPGRQPFARAAELAGVAQPWRPISLAPDLTLLGLVSLVVPFAVLLAMGSINREQRYKVLSLILVATLVGALMAVGQVTAGAGSGFYLYRITNDGVGVGLFSNRNHQAMGLACALPMLAVWAMIGQRSAEAQRLRLIIAAATAAFFVPLVLITGSRTGLALTLLAAAAGALLFPGTINGERRTGIRNILLGLSAVGTFGAVIAWIALPRAATLQRLIGMKLADDQRVTDLPVFQEMISTYWPFGAGLDTFDRAFRIAEPRRLLSPQYLNEAHNDLAQAAITGGLAGLMLIGALVAWIVYRAWQVRRGPGTSREIAFARMGLVVAIMLLLGSLTDYPLRTPWLASVFAIACTWAAGGGRRWERTRSVDGDEAGISK